MQSELPEINTKLTQNLNLQLYRLYESVNGTFSVLLIMKIEAKYLRLQRHIFQLRASCFYRRGIGETLGWFQILIENCTENYSAAKIEDAYNYKKQRNELQHALYL